MPGSTRQTSILQIEQDQADRKARERPVPPQFADGKLQSRLVNSLGGIVWEADPQTFQFTFVSSQAERILGYPVTQWLGDPDFWRDHIHPDDVEWCVNFCLDATANRRDHEFEYRMLAADGSVVWLHDIVTVTVESDGSVRLRGIMIDITERRNAEEALRRNEELFRAIVEDQTEMIVRWKPDGTRTFVNQAYCRVFGKSAEELVGSSFYPLVVERYREGIREKIRSLTPDKPLATEIHEGISANGEPCWQEWTDRGIFDAHGKLVELQSTGRDITERKRAEEALRLSENRYRRIVQMAPEAIVVADMATGKFVDFNPQALALFKVSADEILNVGPIEMSPAFQPDGRASTEAATAYINRALAGETPVFEWMCRSSDGEDIPCEVRLLQLPDESRPLVRGTITDITERKQAEEQLKATSEQLRALMAALRRAREDEGIRIAREIHDELGSALTSLRWDLETIDRAVGESGGRSSARELRERIEAMTGLIDNTLNVIRRISAELRPSVLDDLGLAAAIEWQAQQFEGRTGIICHYDCSIEDLDLNPEQATAIFRIFQEALTNVMRHAAATRIDIRMERKDGLFVLTITDNGKGITEGEKISPRSLGLVGMRERAQLIGGEVELRGIAGEGTCVSVRVPVFDHRND